MKNPSAFLALAIVSFTNVQAEITKPADIFTILDRVYSWQAARKEVYSNQGITGWKHATFYTAVMELYRATGDTRYRNYLNEIGSGANWKLLRVNGDLWRHADNHLIGETYINLYMDEGQISPVKIRDVQKIFDDMIASPWAGRDLYDWCDSLFMSPPVWALLGKLTGDDQYLHELDRLFWDGTAYLYNPQWQLFYRDKNYFNSVEANGNPVFWGRGNGWVVGGLVRILEYLPENWPGRQAYVDLFVAMSSRLAAIQTEEGGWPSSLLYEERFGGETEVSGTSFFVYALAWGINQGILEKATYGPMVERGWAVMNENLNADGSISNIQTVGKEPQPNDNLVNKREYGYGAFILAGLEMAEYYQNADTNTEFWNGFPVTYLSGGKWVNTGKFLGWIEVSTSPIVYLAGVNQWAYLKPSDIPSKGDWVYIFR